ncbi:translation initiation factor IF-2-like [Panthera uncia]|uniref:translation initiation factor IF-2-like n=1 Tax=Panthera uncia TaxID=29064 RepID=UPI0020FFF4B4|nr:translation initiation factor IF-2-like [Panthera uncia]
MLSVKKKWLAWVPAEAPALLLEIKCSRRPPPPGSTPAADQWGARPRPGPRPFRLAGRERAVDGQELGGQAGGRARARARETEGLTGAWRARGREAEGRVAGGEGGRPGTRACERVRPSPLCEPASGRRGPSKAAFRGAREPSRASQNLHVPEAPRAAAVPTAQPPGAAREADTDVRSRLERPLGIPPRESAIPKATCRIPGAVETAARQTLGDMMLCAVPTPRPHDSGDTGPLELSGNDPSLPASCREATEHLETYLAP